MIVRAALALLVLLPLAAAETVMVPGDFDFIQDAVDAAADGDTIVVKKGSYAEAVTIANRHDLLLVGKGKPVIDATGHFSGVIVQDSTNIALIGLRVQSHSESGIHVRGSTDVFVSKCLVTGGEIGIHVDDGASVRLEKNRIEGVSFAGIELFAAGGGGGEDCHLVKNRIKGSAERGIRVRGENNVLEGNVLEDIDVAAIDVVETASLTTLLRNRILAGDGNGILVGGATDTSIERNTILGLGGTGLFVNFDAVGLQTFKNRVTDVAGHGFSIDCTAAHCEGDVIAKVGGDGMDVDGPDGSYVDVKVKAPRDDGWDLDSGGGTFLGCSAVGADGCGFLVDSSNNSFTKCKAKGSFDFDLFNVSGDLTNTFEDCKFKTKDP